MIHRTVSLARGALIRRLLCRLGFHRWWKYELAGDGYIEHCQECGLDGSAR